MNDIMKIVKFPEESGLSIKCVSERIKNEAKEQKEGYLVLLLGKGIYQQVKVQLEQVKTQLEQTRIFNATSSFNKF